MSKKTMYAIVIGVVLLASLPLLLAFFGTIHTVNHWHTPSSRVFPDFFGDREPCLSEEEAVSKIVEDLENEVRESRDKLINEAKENIFIYGTPKIREERRDRLNHLQKVLEYAQLEPDNSSYVREELRKLTHEQERRGCYSYWEPLWRLFK